MAKGMFKGPRNTRTANSQWAPKREFPTSNLEVRQGLFDANSKSAGGDQMRRPGSNTR